MEGSPPAFIYEKRPGYDDAEFAHLLAEDLPIEYAYTTMRKLQGKKGANGWYRSAFAVTELGLCRDSSMSDEARVMMFDEAAYLLRKPMGLTRSETSDVLRLNSAIACSYLPLFQKRALDLPITPEDCDNLYRSVGTAMAMSLSLTNNPSSIIARLAEGIMFGLSARSRQAENLIWPASPREESTSKQPSNHDGYLMYNGTKLRAQAKLIETDSEYEHPTIIVVFEDMVQHVAKKVRQKYAEPVTDSDVVSFAETIFRESTGEEIDPEEKYQLDVATAHLLRPLSVLRQQDRQQDTPQHYISNAA